MDEKEKEKRLQEKDTPKWGCATLTADQCRKCAYSKGPAPFADAPEKGYCVMFPRETSAGKPDSVIFEGQECEFFMTDSDVKKALDILEDERRKFKEQRAKERETNQKGGE